MPLYLYSRRVAFSSRQAVVTFQTLVWPESNVIVVEKHKMSNRIHDIQGIRI